MGVAYGAYSRVWPGTPTPLRSTQSAQDKGEGVGFGRCPFPLYLPFNSIAPTA